MKTLQKTIPGSRQAYKTSVMALDSSAPSILFKQNKCGAEQLDIDPDVLSRGKTYFCVPGAQYWLGGLVLCFENGKRTRQ